MFGDSFHYPPPMDPTCPGPAKDSGMVRMLLFISYLTTSRTTQPPFCKLVHGSNREFWTGSRSCRAVGSSLSLLKICRVEELMHVGLHHAVVVWSGVSSSGIGIIVALLWCRAGCTLNLWRWRVISGVVSSVAKSP
ncbi:hypothetical protein TNCV_1109451 [Trichonephila clavipes]|nr:hypothetical protein TNCV_1109451 [Trichonephila clavipes]